MSKYGGLLGLPPATLNILSGGIAVFLACTGIRIVKAPNLALRVANTQLITSSSAGKLEQLASQLDEKAQIIQEKDQAYEQLKVTYDDWLTNEAGGNELNEAFNAIKELPELDDTEELLTEIEEIEEDLLEVTTEPN